MGIRESCVENDGLYISLSDHRIAYSYMFFLVCLLNSLLNNLSTLSNFSKIFLRLQEKYIISLDPQFLP